MNTNAGPGTWRAGQSGRRGAGNNGPVGLAGLSGKVVIFDEVHSYDVHMSVLLDRLLW